MLSHQPIQQGENENKETNLQTYQTQQLNALKEDQEQKLNALKEQQNEQLSTIEEKNNSYNQLLNKLNQFQQKHCRENYGWLAKFHTIEYLNLARRAELDNFVNLIEYLIQLVPEDKNTSLYSIALNISLNGMQLVQDILTVPEETHWKYSLAKRKISALLNAVQAATNFINNIDRLDEKKYRELIIATEKMRNVIEGPCTLLREENRSLCGFIGAVSALMGAALGGVCIYFLATTTLPTAAIIALIFAIDLGAICAIGGLGMVLHATCQFFSSNAALNQDKQSHKTAVSLNALANSKAVLFSTDKKSVGSNQANGSTKGNQLQPTISLNG